MGTRKEDNKIIIKLNTLVAAQWFSSDGIIHLYDGSRDGKPGITYISFDLDDLDKLPKRELAMAFVNNLLDIEGWDALDWLKTNRKVVEPPKTNTTRNLIFSISPNETFWASKDGSVVLSILPGGQTTIEIQSGDPRMSEFLHSHRSGRLIIVNTKEEGTKPMDKDPSLFFPEVEHDADVLTRARIWATGQQQEVIERIRNLVPEDESNIKLESRNASITFLKALISIEKEKDKPREKVIEVANRALIDLGEFVELSSKDEKKEAREKVTK